MKAKAWRMTYTVKGVQGCSRRGISQGDSKEELEQLAKKLENEIENIVIEKSKSYKE